MYIRQQGKKFSIPKKPLKKSFEGAKCRLFPNFPKEPLFVYGTLRCPRKLRQLLGHSPYRRRAQLPGFRRVQIFQDGCQVPDLYRASTGMVSGYLLQVTPQELDRLDLYEGYPYCRTKEVLADGTTAWVYRTPESKNSGASGSLGNSARIFLGKGCKVPLPVIISYLLLMLLPACSSATDVLRKNTEETSMYKTSYRAGYNQEHHKNGGFQNPWPVQQDEEVNFFKAFGWISGKIFSSGKPGPGSDFRQLSPEELQNNFRHFRVHWLGHATVLMRTHSINIITDPVFSNRVSPVSFAGPVRITPVPLPPEQLPRINLVVISHNHYDHLDLSSLALLKKNFDPLFVVPLGVKDLLLAAGITRVVELDWRQSLEGEGFTVHCLPAKHFSGRGMTDRDETLWASFLIEVFGNKTIKFYFAGDTGYSFHFREIGETFPGIDAAFIPIGAYKPRWFMKRVHVDPEEAVQAFLDLGATQFLGIHWGTFDLADEPLREPMERALAEAKRRNIETKRFHVLPAGGYFDDL